MQDATSNREASNALVLRAGGQSSAEGSNGTGETPVNLSLSPELGIFTETRTAILPIRFAVSFNKIFNNNSGISSGLNVLRIRMNAPYDILTGTAFQAQTEGVAVNTGVSSNQALAYSAGNNPAALLNFETTVHPGTTAPTATQSGDGVPSDGAVCPAWRKWYEKIYESYHTIKTEYRITFLSPETNVGARTNVYVSKDVYTTSSTGNITPIDAPSYFLNSSFHGIDRHIIGERVQTDKEKWVNQLSGTWKPGMWAKNTLNAEDIKAWYATGAGPSPSWFEQLVLMARTDDVTSANTNLNCLVELRYHVQFKDLKQAFRYPYPTGTAVTFTTPSLAAGDTLAQQITAAGDILQVPHSPYPWGSTV